MRYEKKSTVTPLADPSIRGQRSNYIIMLYKLYKLDWSHLVAGFVVSDHYTSSSLP